jgi:hypothetical protein
VAQKEIKDGTTKLRRWKMRKLLALFVMLAVLGVCAQSYGFLVVYNVSFSVKCVDGETAKTIPMKAYMVMEYDPSHENLTDVNLIMYGRDSDRHKVYVVLNEYDSNDFIDASSNVQGDYFIVELDSSDPFDFNWLIIGKRKATNIGLDDREDVAGTLKGVITVRDGILLDVDQEIRGTANVSATNWSGATKYINEEDWTQDQIVTQLRTDLEIKGYDPVVLVP